MEKALLIGVNSGKEQSELLAELEELKELCESCDIEVLDAITQNIQKINHNTYMGSGKIKEIQAWLSGEDCDLIVANDELTPLQIRNLEKTLNVRVYDRTYVILEIFKRRAKTKEAMLQVELASKKYLLPVWSVPTETFRARQEASAACAAGAAEKCNWNWTGASFPNKSVPSKTNFGN